VALTDAGARFLEELAPAFDQIGKAQDSLNDFRRRPFGTVRLNVPVSLASIVLADAVGPVTRASPGLKIEIAASDALVDIVKDGFDAGIRLGERLSQDMIAVRGVLENIRASRRYRISVWV
jgi:DNA-binding transcriptional LysR family regulator